MKKPIKIIEIFAVVSDECWLQVVKNWKRTRNEKQSFDLDSYCHTSVTRSNFFNYNSWVCYLSCQYRNAFQSIFFARHCCRAFYVLSRNILYNLYRFNHKYVSQEKIEHYKLFAHCSHHHNACVFYYVDFFGKNLFIKSSVGEQTPFVRFYLCSDTFSLV